MALYIYTYDEAPSYSRSEVKPSLILAVTSWREDRQDGAANYNMEWYVLAMWMCTFGNLADDQ